MKRIRMKTTLLMHRMLTTTMAVLGFLSADLRAEPVSENVLTGFNCKWLYIPSPESAAYGGFIKHVQSLKPKALRYPGGTITHDWDWRAGTKVHPKKGTIDNPISHLTELVKRTGVDVVFVLDIVHRSLEDQVAMLKASKLPVKYVELGNEIYSGDYRKEFPTGKEYAERVNLWLPELKKQFPKAKFSVALLGRTPKMRRLISWNKLVTSTVKNIDAHTYHIYVKNGISVTERIKDFEKQLITKKGTELWITEYGIQTENALNSAATKHYLRQLDQLRRYVESHARISLCHILITNDFTAKSDNFSAIKYGGLELNPVGKYFKNITPPVSSGKNPTPTGQSRKP